ncbi:MAG: HAD family phosphatase [Chloroflexi bacterium]|nr:HAD family phosphatase [Chloroflexota bacterium]
MKAVAFDVGGVLLRTENQDTRRRLELRYGMAPGGMADLVFNNPVSQKATLGEGTEADVWAYVARHLHLVNGRLEELRRDFWAGDAWDETLLAFAEGLRPAARTGVLSNAWPGARAAFGSHLGRHTFDTVVISAEEGCAKPDARIYRLLLDRLGTLPAETVFVDDLAENVEAARAIGLHAIRFTSTAAVLDGLRRLLR